MHSRRMRTARALTIGWGGGVPAHGGHLPGGAPARGCTWLGCVPAWGVPARGMYLPREMYLPGGCTYWGYLPGGCTCLGGVPAQGVYLPGSLPTQEEWVPEQVLPLCGQNTWHTLLKILPCPKLRLRAVMRHKNKEAKQFHCCRILIIHFFVFLEGCVLSVLLRTLE